MPNELVDLQLGKVELLSVVDKGASGNAEFRPRIVLLKRHQRRERIMGLFDRIRKNVDAALDETLAKETENDKGSPADGVEKADTPQAAFLEMLETMGLSDEQKASLKMAFMSAMAATPPPMPAPSEASATETVEIQKPEDEDPEKPKVKDVDVEAKKETEMAAMAKSLEAMPQDVRKAFESLQARADELEKERAEAIAKAQINEQREVAKRYPHVAGDIEQRAALLLSIKKNQGDKAYDQLIKVYDEAERIAKADGRFGEIGTAQPDPNVDANQAFDSQVKKIQKADKVSYQVAFKRAKEAEPALYAATKGETE